MKESGTTQKTEEPGEHLKQTTVPSQKESNRLFTATASCRGEMQYDRYEAQRLVFICFVGFANPPVFLFVLRSVTRLMTT